MTAKKGFGFIQPINGGRNIFIHIGALDRAGLGHLDAGQKLCFDLAKDDKGRSWTENLQLD